MDYKELLNTIKNEFPDKAINMIESLELLKMTIDETHDAIGEKIKESFSENKFEEINNYVILAKKMQSYEEKIREVIEILDVEDFELEEVIDEKDKTIPDYDKYTIDKNIEYSLYYDFTHKRPYAFKLSNNKIIVAKTWKEILIKLCEFLMKIDEKKFMSFENIKAMNGKKKKYFSVKSKGMISPKSVSNKIYVETNQSANSIRNLLIKLLKEYGFQINDLKIYLRADYTDINKNKNS